MRSVSRWSIALLGPGAESSNEVFQRVWLSLGMVFAVAGVAFVPLYPRRITPMEG